MKKLVKQICPPILISALRKKPKYGFFGGYKTWKETKAASLGYDDEKILEKVKDALLKVKTGKAVFERDSMLFDKIEYSWPVLASLLWIASQNDNTLKLVDFGGSLGSGYFQNIGFLKHLKTLRWDIVEQKNFVESGKKYFENLHLHFFKTLDASTKETKPDAILFLSSFQYLENPYDILNEAVSKNIPYLIFDRTPFIDKDSGDDKIVVQKVPPRIYDASYPCRILSAKKLIQFLSSNNYEMTADFTNTCGMSIFGEKNNPTFTLKGFIFKKK